MMHCILSCLTDFNITFEGIVKTIELILLLAGCIIAGMGLKTWRQQVIEQPKIELAREIVESFYDIIDLIKYIRRNFRKPGGSQYIRDYFKFPDATDYQCSQLETIYELEKNINRIDRFQDLKNKANVIFDKSLEKHFLGIIKIINRIDYNTRILYQTKEEKRDKLSRELKKYNIEQSEDDEVNLQMQNILAEVEKTLKPFYQEKTNIFKRLILWLILKLKSKKKDVENDK